MHVCTPPTGVHVVPAMRPATTGQVHNHGVKTDQRASRQRRNTYTTGAMRTHHTKTRAVPGVALTNHRDSLSALGCRRTMATTRSDLRRSGSTGAGGGGGTMAGMPQNAATALAAAAFIAAAVHSPTALEPACTCITLCTLPCLHNTWWQGGSWSLRWLGQPITRGVASMICI